MNDKYVNSTGVQTIKTWVDGKFGTKTEVDAVDTKVDNLSDRVDDIVAEGGEPNVIETVKVDNVALTPDANKAVNIDLSGKLDKANIELNDSTNMLSMTVGQNDDIVDFIPNANGLTYTTEYGTVNLASTDYVSQNGGKIDKIKVNEEEQTITNKEVNIDLREYAKLNGSITGIGATRMVEGQIHDVKLENSTNGANFVYGSRANPTTKELVDKNYVDTNAGKIDTIKVNGTTQSISNKTVDIAVPIKVSDLTNDSKFQTDTEVEEAISSQISRTYKPAGSVAFANLPSLTKTNLGNVYNITDDFTTTADFVEGAGKEHKSGTNVAIVNTGTDSSPVYKYDVMSGFVDLSNYWNSTNLQAMTVSEINAILNA